MTVGAAGFVGRRAARGAVWSGLNTVVMKVANIAITAVVIRIVSPRDFGVFAVAVTIHTVISSFGELGLSSCLSRADMNPDEVGPTVGAIALVSGTVLASGMALASGPLAAALGAPEARNPIRVLALCVFLGGVTTVPTSLLVREFRQDRLFLAGAVSFVPSNLLLVALAWRGDGAMAFAWSRLAGQIIAAVVVFWAVGRIYRPRIAWAQVAPVLRFGLPLAGANLVNYALLNADYAFVGRRLGPVLLGTYVLAFNVASWATSVLANSVNSVAMPAFSRLKDDPLLLRSSLRRSIRLVALIGLPISALTLALADPLVRSLYGDKWAAASPVLAILSIYGAVFVLSLLLANLLVGVGRAGRLLVVQLIWIAVLVPCMLGGIAWDGVRGVAIAHVVVIVLLVMPVYLLSLARWIPGLISLLCAALAGPFAAACGAGAVAWAASQLAEGSWLQLVAGGLAGGMAYVTFASPMVRAELPAALGGLPGRTLRAYDRTVGKLRRLAWRVRRPQYDAPTTSVVDAVDATGGERS